MLCAVMSSARNDWSAVGWAGGDLRQATARPAVEILDRVGGGDSLASGFIFALLSVLDLARSLGYGAAHGALAMTTPGDVSMATRIEVEALMAGTWARVRR
jgi:2-dehydro-3-deoxygluconokinase